MKAVSRLIPNAFTLITLALVACGGSPSGTNSPGKGPLDPQGNWIFTLTDANNAPPFSFAGQLFELNPPTVTGNNGMGAVGANPPCGFSITANGQASGTNSITLTLSAVNVNTPPAYTLTGTIAQDQAHMSGTFTATSTQGCTSTSTGNWTAALIPAVTGTWVGSAQGSTFTGAIVENTDQASPNMGSLTGSIVVTGTSSCIAPETITLTAVQSVHVGNKLTVVVKDSNGVEVDEFFTVAPGATSGSGDIVFHGGTCDGVITHTTLTKTL